MQRVRAEATAYRLEPPERAPVGAFDADAFTASFNAREAAGVAAAG